MHRIRSDDGLRIGELAERARAPPFRGRHEPEADVRWLYQVVALRFLGVHSRASPARSSATVMKAAVTAQPEAVDAEFLHVRRPETARA